MGTKNERAAIPGISEELDRLSEDEVMDLEEALENLSDGEAFVRISKWVPEDAVFAACARVPASGFDPLSVLNRWGPGKYQFRVYSRGKLVKQRSMTILGDARAAAPTGAPDLTTDRLVTTMFERAQKQEAFQQSLLLALVTGLAGKPAGGSGEAGIRAADILAAVREGRESVRAQPVPETANDLVFKALELGIDVANGRLGSGSTDNEGGGLLSYVPRVLSIIEKGMERAPAPQRIAAPARPVGVPAPAGDVSVANPQIPENPLRALLPAILGEARANRDPYTWGYWLGERLTGEHRDVALAFVALSPEERKTELLTLEPAIAHYIPWVEEAVKGLSETLGLTDSEHDGSANVDTAG